MKTLREWRQRSKPSYSAVPLRRFLRVFFRGPCLFFNVRQFIFSRRRQKWNTKQKWDMAVPSFLIKNGDTNFMSRQKNVFDVLSVIEKETSLSRPPQAESMVVDDKRTINNKRKRTKRFRGKESMFKVPTDPPPKFHRPGQNPNRGRKWIKYSLSDVSEYDLSKEGNTAAALSFLKSLKERKEAGKAEGETLEINAKHLFKTPEGDKQEQDGDEVKVKKSVFVSSKLIMPEYVVGQNKKPKKSVKKSKVEKTKEVYLDHIHMYEDE